MTTYTAARTALDELLSQTTRGSITAPDLKEAILDIFDAFETDILATAPVYAGGLIFTYSTTTTMADPGTGVIRFNHATLASATAAAIDDLSALTGNPDVSGKIVTWDDSTDTVKGMLTVAKLGDPDTYVAYNLTALTDNSGWTQLTLSYVGAAGTLANGDSVVCTFQRNGSAGTTSSPSFTGTVDITQALKVSGDVTPTQITSNTDNWAPTNFSTNTVLRVSTDVSRNLTGIAAGADGLVKILLNVGSFSLTLAHDATSTAANRFYLPDSVDMKIRPGAGVIIWYDATSSRWRAVSMARATALLSDVTATLTVGYTATAYDAGTKSSGTFTPDPANGNLQRYINGGAHTLAAPTASGDYTITLQVTNNGSAGAITLSSFTKTSGDSLTTTNGDDFLLHIVKINGFTRCYKEALQ